MFGWSRDSLAKKKLRNIACGEHAQSMRRACAELVILTSFFHNKVFKSIQSFLFSLFLEKTYASNDLEKKE